MSRMKAFKRYEDAEKDWLKIDKPDPRHLGKEFVFRFPASEMILELKTLYYATNDERFMHAAEAIEQSHLYDARDMEWTQQGPVDLDSVVEKKYYVPMCMLINHLIDCDYSLRLACANAAANMAFPGNSFAAAVKSVERAWRERQRDPELDKRH